jgi:hypothetical protein
MIALEFAETPQPGAVPTEVVDDAAQVSTSAGRGDRGDEGRARRRQLQRRPACRPSRSRRLNAR